MKVKLGTIFTNTGNFNLTKKHLADKALKAMYEVWKIGRMYKLSIKCLHDLFDKMIKPILLYGREVWGFSNNDILEKIHLKFCKILLNLKTSTPSYMVYGELGRYPVRDLLLCLGVPRTPLTKGGPSSCQKKLTMFTVYMFDLI